MTLKAPMNTPAVLSAWLKGHVASTGTLTCVSGRLYSYQEQIALLDPRLGVVYILTPRRRSKTTMRHRSGATRAAVGAGLKVLPLKEPPDGEKD